MTKSEIISQIAQRAGVTSKVAGGVLSAFIGLINQTLKDEAEIRIDQLGTFRVVERKARIGVNPKLSPLFFHVNLPRCWGERIGN